MDGNESAMTEALSELVKEEDTLANADDTLGRALARYRIAAKRYAAVRDVLEEMLNGRSPYAGEDKEIKALWLDSQVFASPNFGRYRYLFKAVGDAVYEVLGGADTSLTLTSLVSKLKVGGLTTDARAVNASLLNMKGVRKYSDGTYELDEGPPDEGPPMEDVDDLPF